MKKLMPAIHWANKRNMMVIDPDGWRQRNIAWETPITLEDFILFASTSTVSYCKRKPNNVNIASAEDGL